MHVKWSLALLQPLFWSSLCTVVYVPPRHCTQEHQCVQHQYCSMARGICMQCSYCNLDRRNDCPPRSSQCKELGFNYMENDLKPELTPSCNVVELEFSNVMGRCHGCRTDEGLTRCFVNAVCNVTCVAPESAHVSTSVLTQPDATDGSSTVNVQQLRCTCVFSKMSANCSWSQPLFNCAAASQSVIEDSSTLTAVVASDAVIVGISVTFGIAGFIGIIAVVIIVVKPTGSRLCVEGQHSAGRKHGTSVTGQDTYPVTCPHQDPIANQDGGSALSEGLPLDITRCKVVDTKHSSGSAPARVAFPPVSKCEGPPPTVVNNIHNVTVINVTNNQNSLNAKNIDSVIIENGRQCQDMPSQDSPSQDMPSQDSPSSSNPSSLHKSGSDIARLRDEDLSLPTQLEQRRTVVTAEEGYNDSTCTSINDEYYSSLAGGHSNLLLSNANDEHLPFTSPAEPAAEERRRCKWSVEDLVTGDGAAACERLLQDNDAEDGNPSPLKHRLQDLDSEHTPFIESVRESTAGQSDLHCQADSVAGDEPADSAYGSFPSERVSIKAEQVGNCEVTYQRNITSARADKMAAMAAESRGPSCVLDLQAKRIVSLRLIEQENFTAWQ